MIDLKMSSLNSSFIFQVSIRCIFYGGLVDQLKSPSRKGLPSEGKLIENLLGRIGEDKVMEILEQLAEDIEFFSQRIISRMDKRTPKYLDGKPKEGEKWRDSLRDGSDA